MRVQSTNSGTHSYAVRGRISVSRSQRATCALDVVPPSREALRSLLDDLDSKQFRVRETAVQKLRALGERAEPAIAPPREEARERERGEREMDVVQEREREACASGARQVVAAAIHRARLPPRVSRRSRRS